MDLFDKYNSIIDNYEQESNNDIDNKSSFKCNNCGSENYQNVNNQIICLDCGNILSYSNMNSSEITTDSKILSPVEKLLFQNTKINTMIRFKNPLLNKIQYWNVSYQEKANKKIVGILTNNCEKLELNQKILKDAINLYFLIYNNIDGHKRILNEDNYIHTNFNQYVITRGNNKLGIIGACLYYACKQNNYLIDIKKIAEAFELQTLCLHRGCKMFNDAIKKTNININTNIVLPIHFINYISDKMNIDNSNTKKIKEIIVKIQDNNLCVNHSPLSVCICTVILYYRHINKKLFNKKVSNLFNISNVTINKTLCDLNKYQLFLFDDTITLTPSTDTVNRDIQNSINKKIKELEKINVKNYNQISNINPKYFFI